MKIGLIKNPEGYGEPRLVAGLGNGTAIDIARVLQDRDAAAAGLALNPAAMTLKDVFSLNRDEIGKLEQIMKKVGSNNANDKEYSYREDDISFLPPIPADGVFLCVGKNYKAHVDELVRKDMLKEIPREPTGFIKLNRCLSGHRSRVEKPQHVSDLDYEPELAFILGRAVHGVRKSEAMDCVFGVTLFNDLTAREVQKREVEAGTRFWTAKNMPGFGPFGPYVVTMNEIKDINDINLHCYVNNEHRMTFNTKSQIFKYDDIIEHFSKNLSFNAGDVFSTGSAAGTAFASEDSRNLFLKPGDTVEIHLEDTMVLRTHIVAPGGAR